MKKYRIDIILNLIGLAVITYFFLPLFYPHLSLFVTPEVGVSDIWQFNIPIKLLMSQALQGNYIPLWTNTIGTGFPILAESQMGFFNLFSLVLYALFSHLVAFNLQYILIYFFSFCGMYVFLRNSKISSFASFLGGFTFTFSGFYIAHISHQNMILTASYIPWIFLLIDLFTKTKKARYLLLGVILISQQIFAGYMQIAFITWIFMGLYVIVTACFEKENDKKDVKKSLITRGIVIGAIVGLAFIISSAQIIPTSELIDRTSRKNGLSPAENIHYSYPFKHLITLLNPFLLGSPRDGTYPHYNQFDGSIFWENTGYIGLIPLALAIVSLFSLRKNKRVIIFVLLLLASLLLMTGKHSPFYFIHTLPPFNKFRIPSRYIVMFIFALCTLGAIGFDEALKRGKNWWASKNNVLVGVILIGLSVVNIFYIWRGYHLIGKASDWSSDPQTAQHIKQSNNTGRIYSTVGSAYWINYFLASGWSKDNDIYFYFRNGLPPNYNILTGINQYDSYVGKVNTNRQIANNTIIMSGIIELDNKMINVSTTSAKLLGLSNVRYVIVPAKLESNTFERKFETTKNPTKFSPFYVYENKNYLSRVRIVYDYSVSKTLESIEHTLTAAVFDPKNTVVLEKDPKRRFTKKCSESLLMCPSSIKFIKDGDMNIELKTTSTNDGILILADSYYPGWKAFIDDKETTILPANLNQRAIVLPAGKHIVRFEYKPANFILGLRTSIIGYFAIISLLVIEWRTSFLDRFFRKQKLFSDL